MDKILRYKIHSKLVFLKKKIAHLKKKQEEEGSRMQVNSARELHCSLFLSEPCTQYTVHVNCTVHWTVQLTWTVKKRGLGPPLPIVFMKGKKGKCFPLFIKRKTLSSTKVSFLFWPELNFRWLVFHIGVKHWKLRKTNSRNSFSLKQTEH